MYKILTLGAHKELKTITNDLTEADFDMTISQFSDLELFIDKDNTKITFDGDNILSFDYVWLTSSWGNRPLAYAVSLFLEENDINYYPVEEEKSKLVDMILFSLKGINIPKTYFTNTKNIQNHLTSIEKHCKYPFIIKATRGSLGDDIYLVNSKEEFKTIVKKLNQRQQYICQEFILNDFDYRIICTNEKVVSACKRVRQTDDFRNNTYLGAKEIFLDLTTLPSEVSNIAVESTSILDLNWSGVDVISNKETGESYIIELNRRPGLTDGSSEMEAAYDHILSLAKELV